MVSDRTSCANIYMVLIMMYPETWYSYVFLTFFFLDFGCHFLQFNAAALVKSESNKKDVGEMNIIVRYYYTNHVFL